MTSLPFFCLKLIAGFSFPQISFSAHNLQSSIFFFMINYPDQLSNRREAFKELSLSKLSPNRFNIFSLEKLSQPIRHFLSLHLATIFLSPLSSAHSTSDCCRVECAFAVTFPLPPRKETVKQLAKKIFFYRHSRSQSKKCLNRKSSIKLQSIESILDVASASVRTEGEVIRAWSFYFSLVVIFPFCLGSVCFV